MNSIKDRYWKTYAIFPASSSVLKLAHNFFVCKEDIFYRLHHYEHGKLIYIIIFKVDAFYIKQYEVNLEVVVLSSMFICMYMLVGVSATSICLYASFDVHNSETSCMVLSK